LVKIWHDLVSVALVLTIYRLIMDTIFLSMISGVEVTLMAPILTMTKLYIPLNWLMFYKK
jgi:hypothetical protein